MRPSRHDAGPRSKKGKKGLDPLEVLSEVKTLSKSEKKAVSRFAKEFKRLAELSGANNDNFTADAHRVSMLRAILTMNLDLLPIAEKQYRTHKNESMLYALSALSNATKDASSELRALADVGGQADYIVREVINPMLVLSVQHLLAKCTSLKVKIDSSSLGAKEARSIKEHIDSIAREMATVIQAGGEAIAPKVHAHLTGESDAPKPKAKKNKGPK